MENIEQLFEVFDENSPLLSYTNINPKQKPMQTIALDSFPSKIVVRFAGTKVLGEKVTNLKASDKAMQIILFGLSDKGNFSDLKNGLSRDPIDVINTIVSLVKDRVRIQQLETIMFRFPTKKLKGREKTIQRIIKVLARKHLRSFVALEEIEVESAKHSYVVLYKKSKGLESQGLPPVNLERFTKVDTSVGDVYVDTSTGEQVSKAGAIAKEIVSASVQTDKEIMNKTKVSRSAIMSALYSTDLFNVVRSKDTQEYYDELQSNIPVVQSSPDKTPNLNYSNLQNEIKIVATNLMDFGNDGDISTSTNANTSPFAKAPAYDTSSIKAFILQAIKNKNDKDLSIKSNLGKQLYKNSVNDIGKIFENIDVKNVQASIVELANYFTTNPLYANFDKYDIRSVITRLVESVLESGIGKSIINNYKSQELIDQNLQTYSEDQIKAIKAYTGSHYSFINEFLIGEDPKIPNMLKPVINNLDEAFKNGMTLEKGVVLYRGQKVLKPQFKYILDNKIIYFKNYVSASLFPVIYNKFGNAALNILPSSEEIVDDNNESIVPHSSSVDVAMVIKGADKIKTIVPGGISSFPDECEVILPRGVAFKINKITGEVTDYEDVVVEMDTCLMECSVMSPDQLSESFDAIDGDLLINEGKIEIKRFSFKSMYESSKQPLMESIIPENSSAQELLLSMFDIDNLNPKFK